jgi:hypothetical protein
LIVWLLVFGEICRRLFDGNVMVKKMDLIEDMEVLAKKHVNEIMDIINADMRGFRAQVDQINKM